MNVRNCFRALSIVVTVWGLTCIAGHGQEVSAPDKERSSDGIEFIVRGPNNTATFESQAPLEDIIGTSDEIGGYLVFDPDNPQAGGRGRISLPVSSINTGIPLRDEHLQGSDWLDAAQYPDINYEIHEITDVEIVKSKEGSTTYSALLSGSFSCHGKSIDLQVAGTFVYMKQSDVTLKHGPGNQLIARAEFSVSIEDFDVPSSRFKKLLGSKVSEEIQISVTLRGSDALQVESGDTTTTER